MNIEEEIADEISGIQVGSGYYATTIGIDAAQEVADAVMPLVKRAQAEAIRDAARFLRGPDNPQRGKSFVPEMYAMDDAGYQLFRYADRIENEGERA